MDFLDILSGDSAIGKLANTYVTGLANAKAKPKPVIVKQAAPVIQAAPAKGMDMSKIAMIGGGVIALLVVVMVVGRRK